jgi:hypothetical protein
VDATDKEKADPCGMTTKKGNDKGNGEALGVMTKINRLLRWVGIGGWVKPTSQNRDVGHPA